jgi:hypothetical protein
VSSIYTFKFTLLLEIRRLRFLYLRHLLVRPIELLEIRAEPGKKKADLARHEEDVAGVPGGGEAETSPETGTAWLAATSPAEVRSKNLGWGCGILGCGGRRSWGRWVV